jgi:hypothetical protein
MIVSDHFAHHVRAFYTIGCRIKMGDRRSEFDCALRVLWITDMECIGPRLHRVLLRLSSHVPQPSIGLGS